MKVRFVLIALVFSTLLGAQRPRQGSRSPGQIPSGDSGPNLLVNFHGTLSGMSSKKFVLTLDDSKKGEENSMEISLSRKTVALDGDKKMKITDLKNGQTVDVESKRLIDGTIEAVVIHVAH